MNTITSIPPFRDLPPDRLEERKRHLVAEIERDEGKASDWTRPSRWRITHTLPHQRRLVVVLAVAAILGTLVATPAFGVRGTLLDLLGRVDVPFVEAPPAASVIKQEFSEMSTGAPRGMDPRVTSGEARLAGTIDFGGVKRHVWVAPTEQGGFCYLFEGISGGCTETKADPIVLDGRFFARPDGTTPALEALAGKILAPDATQLRVIFEDGGTTVLPFLYISKPIEAGFFLYKPSRAEQQPGHRPLEVVIVNSTGKELGRESIDWGHEERKLRQLRDTLPEKPILAKPRTTAAQRP